MTALCDCYDPEIPVNIVDLGLIYDVRVVPNEEAAPVETSAPTDCKVEVDMTLTAQGCPSHVEIGQQVKRRIEQMPGVKEANVNVVWSPPWGPEKMSQAAKDKLGIG